MIYRLIALVRNFRFLSYYSSFYFIKNGLTWSIDKPDRFKFFWRSSVFHKGVSAFGSRYVRTNNMPLGNPTLTDPTVYGWQEFVYDTTAFVEPDKHFSINPYFFYSLIELEQSRALMGRNRNRRWGTEIGIRYVPSHFSISAYGVGGLDFLTSDTLILESPHKHGSLTWIEMTHVILAGGPDNYLDKYDSIYKFWSHGLDTHVRFLDINALTTAVRSFWGSPTRKLVEDAVKNWYAYGTQASFLGKQWSKWQLLTFTRAKLFRNIAPRIGFFHALLFFISDLRSGFFKIKK